MAEVIWTETSLQDLDRIADYISLDKPDAARKLVREVFARVVQLQDHPDSGSIPSELRRTRYRQLIIPPLRVFYRREGRIVYIVHVMRGERHFRRSVLTRRKIGS